MEDDRRRQLRAAGAVLASCALCAVLAVMTVSGRSDGTGSSLLAHLPALAPLEQLHWVNHEFRQVRKPAQQHVTALEQADEAAERKADISAHWGTLAATKDVFRSKEFTDQLEQMKKNAELSENRAQKLTNQIQYEGKLLQVGAQDTNHIIAQAAMAARDASFVTDPADRNSRQEVRQEAGWHNHEFVRVYPKPFHYAAKEEHHAKELKKDEKRFLAGVNHQMKMKTLAGELKISTKSVLAAKKSTADTDDILDSKKDMTNGVDDDVTAAAAKRLATARGATLHPSKGSAGATLHSLVTPGSKDEDLLDNKEDLDNGVDSKAEQEAAKKLADSLVSKMHQSAALADKAKEDEEEDKKKKAQEEHDKETMKVRQAWSKDHPQDDAKVVELKKELWHAEEEEKTGDEAKVATVAMKQSDDKKVAKKDAKKDADNEEAKKKAQEEHDKEVMKARHDWSKDHPKDDKKVVALKNALWDAEDAENKASLDKADTKMATVAKKADKKVATVALKKSDGKKKDDDAEAEKKKAAEEHDKDVMQARQDWSKANPKDDAKVVELKKDLWHAEEEEKGAQAKEVAAVKSSAEGVTVAASAARNIETSDGKSRSKYIAKAMKSAVKNAVKTIVDEMSAKPAAKKAAKEAKDVEGKVKKESMVQQIEAIARGVERESSKLQMTHEPNDNDKSESYIIAKQLSQQILEAKRDEESHKNAAQLAELQAQAIAVRQNAVLEAAHEAALDYPGATLSGPRQESYL